MSSLPSSSPSSANNVSDLPVRAGQVLEGKFRVERIIGEGAMGLVVEATHLDLEERVALKFLRREARARPDIVSRFAREARAAAKIKSDHVARVYDVGGTDDGSPFIVMEFLEGSDLEAMLLQRGPLDPTEAVEYVVQACEGLAAAHAHGIVHRDIKPGNLFITDRGGIREVKLLDFGISKAGISGSLDDIDLVSANTTQIMGSPHYMSPEQIRSTKDVDIRADIWSMGVVLFELVTNQTPFTATDVTSIIAQILHEPHRTVRSLNADVSTGLEEVIERCLTKDPEKRYQTAADLAVALLPFAPKRSRAVVERASAMMTRAAGKYTPFDSLPPPLATPSVVTSTNIGEIVPTASAATPSAPSPRATSPFVWVALAAVVLGLVGGAFALFARRRAPEAAATVVPAPEVNVASTQPTATTTTAPTMPAKTEPAAPSALTEATAMAQPAGTAHTTVTAAQPAPLRSATAPRPFRPVAHPAGSASGPAATPSNPESEIRYER